MNEAFRERIYQENFMWRNRRRMAWISFFSMLVVTALCFFWVPESRLEKLSDVITWYYMAMASIVGAYMGFTTWASKSGESQYQQYYQSNGAGVEMSVDDDGQGDMFTDEQLLPPKKKRVRVPRIITPE